MSQQAEFRLIGHNCSFGHYPSPVVPIGIKGDEYLAAYLESDRSEPYFLSLDCEFFNLGENSNFVEHSEQLTRSLHGFDCSQHRLFARTRESVTYYPITEEEDFFCRLLSQDSFSAHNPFFRLSLAKSTRNTAVIRPELIRCVSYLKSDGSEDFLESWFQTQREQLSTLWKQQLGEKFPASWYELPFFEQLSRSTEQLRFTTYRSQRSSRERQRLQVIEKIALPDTQRLQPPLWAPDPAPVRWQVDVDERDLQVIVNTVYKQVLGNTYVLKAERLQSAESLLRNRSITVREFVKAVAKSDLYRSRFFNNFPQYRFIELNFKHLLGRPPIDQAEISEHVQLYNKRGYEAEIDSYIDSDEYKENFGEDIVPYLRSFQTQTGLKTAGFNRIFTLYRGSATSDREPNAKLVAELATNGSAPIVPPGISGVVNNRGKLFRIEAVGRRSVLFARRASTAYLVPYEQLYRKIQAIQRSGGRIVNITERS